MSERRVALITGGARGIGRALGTSLAGDGWDIAICFRTSEADAASAAVEMEQRGASVLSERCDVSHSEAVAGLIGTIEERFGRLDAIINAAGPYHRARLLEETPEGWRSMFTNNLDPVFYTARYGVPLMKRHGWGRILSFSMASADRVVANKVVTAHFIAKMGVIALTRALAKELAPHGITANVLSPGFVDSKSAPEEELKKMAKKIPAGGVGTVADVVAAARFFLSEEAGYTSGANLIVSGAWGI